MVLTDEMAKLLRIGAATHYGRICYPGEVRRHARALAALHDAKLIFYGDNGDTPIISDRGREAIGGPDRAELLRLEAQATAPSIAPDFDLATPHAVLDPKYRSGKTLVFAMVQHRTNDSGTALLLSLDGYWDHAKWFPIARLTIQRSRVEERFMVVQMPGRLANEKGLPVQNTRPRLTPLIAWTDEQLAEWRHVTDQRIRINDAVRRSERRRPAPQRMRFGETA